ncbi:MAG: maleylpyruvate isomerase family mycothiol-dependent enzyme [Acidimicrobiales bacterium]
MTNRQDAMEWLEAATSRLEATTDQIGADDLLAASALPGWSRAHVLAHIAGNANGLRSLLLAARSGEALRMYANPNARVADITAGAARPHDVILADVVESARRLRAEARSMPEPAWAATVTFTSGQPSAPGQPSARSFPAGRLLYLRLVEVEVHHVDLAMGYSFSDTPTALSEWLLDDFCHRCGGALARGDDGQWTATISDEARSWRCAGSTPDLLAWLAGRSAGAGIESDGEGLPRLTGLG